MSMISEVVRNNIDIFDESCESISHDEAAHDLFLDLQADGHLNAGDEATFKNILRMVRPPA